ncbi:unnamed protein product [Heterosigma akashiwo]|mmetsp:Transcript_18839/g.30415  ORF Transcript_18839/g.30415 Transcript_18839/m.30415 type:complete len:111 (+) Transcript_18839:498-830(+)
MVISMGTSMFASPWVLLILSIPTKCGRKLNKALYGLKQSTRIWYLQLHDHLCRRVSNGVATSPACTFGVTVRVGNSWPQCTLMTWSLVAAALLWSPTLSGLWRLSMISQI